MKYAPNYMLSTAWTLTSRTLPHLVATHGPLWNTHGMLQSRDALRAQSAHNFLYARAVDNDAAQVIIVCYTRVCE